MFAEASQVKDTGFLETLSLKGELVFVLSSELWVPAKATMLRQQPELCGSHHLLGWSREAS